MTGIPITEASQAAVPVIIATALEFLIYGIPLSNGLAKITFL